MRYVLRELEKQVVTAAKNFPARKAVSDLDIALPDGTGDGPYLEALRADLDAALPMIWGRRISCVFFGGGTPSLFSPTAIGRPWPESRPMTAGRTLIRSAT